MNTQEWTPHVYNSFHSLFRNYTSFFKLGSPQINLQGLTHKLLHSFHGRIQRIKQVRISSADKLSLLTHVAGLAGKGCRFCV